MRFLIVVFALLISFCPAYAAKKLEIVNLSAPQAIDSENQIGTALVTARKKEGAVLSKKLRNRLIREGLKVRVRSPNQSGVKLSPSPSTVKLIFDPDTETFSSTRVFYIPQEIN